jgi:hypothetical protein
MNRKVEIMFFATILGTLGVLAWPSIKPACSCKKPEGEARYLVGRILRFQNNAYVKKGKFASSLSELYQLSNSDEVLQQTKNYQYSTEYNTSLNVSFVYAKSRKESIKSFVGGVFVINNGNAEIIICSAKSAGQKTIMPPIDSRTCGQGTHLINRTSGERR